jgi:hypothetical protein
MNPARPTAAQKVQPRIKPDGHGWGGRTWQNAWQRPGNADAVWQRSINRWQKVLRMKRGWWNCCIEMDAAAKQFLEERSNMRKCHERLLEQNNAKIYAAPSNILQ